MSVLNGADGAKSETAAKSAGGVKGKAGKTLKSAGGAKKSKSDKIPARESAGGAKETLYTDGYRRIAGAPDDDIPFAWKNQLKPVEGAKNSKILHRLDREEDFRRQASKDLAHTDE